MILGIDYGSKLAGTTVIASLYEHNKVAFYSSEKKQDADQFILDYVKENKHIWLIFLDAPLSLPLVYQKEEEHENYFYRACDLETKAMSPLFLGGLTARAMKLKRELNLLGVKVVETYPSQLADILQIKELGYKKETEGLTKIIKIISKESKLEVLEEEVKNWHFVDAFLCLFSAKRHETGKSIVFGNSEEGQIIV